MMSHSLTTVKFLESQTGRIVYNLGIVALVFLGMSLGMNVFAERPGLRSESQSPMTHYLWQVMHYQEIQEIKKQVDFLYGRIYLFKRMQGDPSMWGWEQQSRYDDLYAEYQTLASRYQELATQYNGENGTTFASKARPTDYMPYARY